MSKVKYIIAAGLLVAGTAVFTYATTRTWTTELVLTRAGQRVSAYLEAHDLLGGRSNADVSVDENTHLESRQLLGSVYLAGGMYYWWNDAIPYWGLGTLLFATGWVVPLVGTRSARREAKGGQ